jgi:hypothetical protein
MFISEVALSNILFSNAEKSTGRLAGGNENSKLKKDRNALNLRTW